MDNPDRRLALAFGLVTSVAVPALLGPTAAFAQRYRPDEGKEVFPGVRRVDLTKRRSELPGYATVAMRDIVYQPGAKSSSNMTNDMVCHCLEGTLQINQGPGMDFAVKAGDVWSCKKGMPEATENKGADVAIMRVIDLLPSA